MSAPVEVCPDDALPVEKPPAEVQELAFVEDQVSVEDCPLLMVSGLALRVAVGEAGGGVLTVQVFEF